MSMGSVWEDSAAGVGKDSVSDGVPAPSAAVGALGFDNTGRFNVGFTGAFGETSGLGGVATDIDAGEFASP